MHRRHFLKGSVAIAASTRIAHAGIFPRGAVASSSAGQTFDFYISTTGSDSNAGTLAAPWAITSLTRTSANRSAIAGKRIGLLPGTYGIYNLWITGVTNLSGNLATASSSSTGTYAYNSPVLALPSGASTTARTFLGASDSSGHQTIGSNPRNITHAITASPSGTPGGGMPGYYASGLSSQSIAMAGFDCRDAVSANTTGHVQIDGIAFSDSTNLAVSFYGNTTAGGATLRITDCWLTNCLVYNVGGDEGNNTGAVWHGGGADNGGVQNCVIHDCVIPLPPNSPGTPSTQQNCAGIFSEAALNQLYEYNTIYNCNCGIYDKNFNNGGNIIRYNYIEVNGWNPNACLNDCAGGPSGTTAYVYNNILVIAPLTGNYRFLWNGICTNSPGANPDQSMQFYNNTCYVLSGGGTQGGIVYQSPGSGSVTHYNNIYVGAAPGSYDTVSFNSGAGVIAISDYNAYIGGCGDHMGQGTNGTPTNTYTLANWRTNFSLDTHSFNQASESGVFSNPAQPQLPTGYQLAGGSPCAGAGSSNGNSGGSACDMGAWGGASPPSRIGSSLS